MPAGTLKNLYCKCCDRILCEADLKATGIFRFKCKSCRSFNTVVFATEEQPRFIKVELHDERQAERQTHIKHFRK